MMRATHGLILLCLLFAGCPSDSGSGTTPGGAGTAQAPGGDDTAAGNESSAGSATGSDNATSAGDETSADADASAAAAGATAITPENTTIQFVGTHKGEKPDPRTGKFAQFNGTAEVKDGKLESVSVEIETASLTTDIEKLTNHLKSPDFFDVKQHPKAMFKSTKIEDAGEGKVNITGDLTLLGTTKSITFPATVSTESGLALESTFEIDRTEFGMDFGTDNVHEAVAMTVTVGK